MTIQVEFWHLVTLALTIGGMFAAISQRLANSVQQGLEVKFQHVEGLIRKMAELSEKNTAAALQLERDLSALRLEMMRDFTRREDHNAAIASIRVAVDNMSLRIEKALATGGRVND